MYFFRSYSDEWKFFYIFVLKGWVFNIIFCYFYREVRVGRVDVRACVGGVGDIVLLEYGTRYRDVGGVGY